MTSKSNTRLGAGLGLMAVLAAAATALILTASTAAANPNAGATASISVSGDSTVCHLTVSYTWSGFPGGKDIAEVRLAPTIPFGQVHFFDQQGSGGSQSWTFDFYNASGSTWQGAGDLQQGKHDGHLGILIPSSVALSPNTVSCP